MYSNFTRNDGFGAQYQTIIFTAMYCGLHNIQFIYKPFGDMQHNYENDPDFLKKKEEFVNLIGSFRTTEEVECPEAPFGIFQEVESNLDVGLKCENLQIIKKCIRKNKSNYNPEFINIAIHIRRRNSQDNTGGDSENYYSDESYFLQAIEFIRNNHEGKKKFHIYSQGEASDFSKFNDPDIELHLNEEIEKTFFGLVDANILVMSKSSMSYSAALLSDGVVYYQPFWHRPASHWRTF